MEKLGISRVVQYEVRCRQKEFGKHAEIMTECIIDTGFEAHLKVCQECRDIFLGDLTEFLAKMRETLRPA